MLDFNRLLETCRNQRASEALLAVGAAPAIRFNGTLRKLDFDAVASRDIDAAVRLVMDHRLENWMLTNDTFETPVRYDRDQYRMTILREDEQAMLLTLNRTSENDTE